MSSPMNWFRHHQKYILAILGVVCIVGFIIWEPLVRMMGNQPGDQNPVVVRTNSGDVRERELQSMREGRARVNQFLEMVAMTTAEALAQSGRMNPQQISMFILRNFERDGLYGPDYTAEQVIVRNMLLANKARDLGMQISNEAVFNYLNAATLGNVTPDVLRQIIDRMGVPQKYIFDELRAAMLSGKVQQMVFGGLQGATPAAQWDYFQRLNRKVNAEVVAVPVASFTGKVAPPDEASLRALYEKYKNRYSNPASPEPGFRQPPKGRFEGFKADYDQFAAQVQVTDAEVEKYYNENLSEFPYTEETPEEAKLPEAPPADAAPATDEKPADEKPAEAAPAENPPAETTAPAETPPAESAPADNPPPAEPNEGGGGDDTPPADPPAAAEPAEPAETPAAEAPATEGAGPALTTGDAAPPPADAPPAAEKPADSKPALSPVLPTTELDLPGDIAGGATPEHNPLWRVADRIKKQLLGQKVNEQINAIFDELSIPLEDYSSARLAYDVEQEEIKSGELKAGATKTALPPPVNFAELAKKHGVEALATNLIAPAEAQSTDLGQSEVDGRPFVEVAFDNLSLFSPRRSQDIGGNHYLFWKIEQSPEHVPTFEKAREAVLAAYKTIEARKLAEDRAAQMAAEAQKAGKSLKDLFGSDTRYQVSETGLFSWMSENPLAQPFGQSQATLSSVNGVAGAGPDFMRAVFGLEPGQVGYAFNESRDTVYVIRVIDQQPAESDLLAQFLGANPQQYMAASQSDRDEFMIAFMNDIESDAGVQWERPARAPNRTR